MHFWNVLLISLESQLSRMTDSAFHIDGTLIGNQDSIDERVAQASESDQEAVRLSLGYLYLDDGIDSLSREHKSHAEASLTPVELFVFQWLYKRTDGKLRRHYGPRVLDAVKRSRYRCEKCNFADVRVLHLEKVETDSAGRPKFSCLCANCNTIAAREREMGMQLAEKAERDAKEAPTAQSSAESPTPPSHDAE